MNDWLYPLSRTAGRFFEDAAGNKLPDTCFGCFLHMAHSGVTDDHWYLAKHAAHVKRGDRVWVYYGKADDDRGVVALATVTAPKPFPDGTPGIGLKWNKRATNRLLAHPYPADKVRQSVPFPRAAVIDLGRFPRLVTALVKQAGTVPTTPTRKPK